MTDPCLLHVGLEALSAELLSLIVEDDCLSLEDLAALRLSCSSLNDAASAVLFRRIYISPLVQDRTSFLKICHSPRLAQHVREVEWSELLWFPSCFENYLLHPYGLRGTDNVSETEESSEESRVNGDKGTEGTVTIDDAVVILDRSCDQAFWLPVVPSTVLSAIFETETPAEPDEGVLLLRTEAVNGFRWAFCEALALLPNLHTMASRPMSRHRVIRGCYYPMTAGHIQVRLPGRCEAPWNWSSDGLYLFILPAMATMDRPVRRLVWEDGLRGNGVFGRPEPEAFRYLDTLSISLSKWNLFHGIPSITDATLSGVRACLDVSSNVRHLTLEVEDEIDRWSLIDDCTTEKNLLRYSPGIDRSEWTRLHSLSLISMNVGDEMLIAVVRESAETLCHLYLEECNMTLNRVKKLSKISNLKLQSVRVLSEYPRHQCHMIPERKLLDYLNDQIIPEGEDVDMCTFQDQQLEDIVDDDDEFDLKLSIYYKENQFRMFEDDCPQFLATRLVMTLPAFIIGGTSLDDDEFEIKQAYKRGYSDDWADQTDLELIDVVSVTESEDSVTERIRNGPKWFWGRYFHRRAIEGEIYFMQVDDIHPQGWPTTIWKFTSREGLVYYGQDPLDAFEEWDTEQGDLEEATPYGRDMELVISQTNERPPEGAWLYDVSEAERAREWGY
ncbi:unnamed protein product [Clonostachys rosea f. rosea IK726]|uniref:Uncharacterized protein n=1 Tax=Clonostachys rosea f. rosea IK726 TaxID=1349383 RepID=A0ACA9TPQ4_BIOOC|nr:unnamed protein product [Clonostachys rosea f. rosea IK726]